MPSGRNGARGLHDGHSTLWKPRPVTTKLFVTILLLGTWAAVYAALLPASEWIVRQLPLDPTSGAAQALAFFIYDTPKVLMLLTLIVFAMGVVQGFFSPERTRALLAGRRAASQRRRRRSGRA
ncbi:MAG: hypothetical protein MZV49_07165 [Rhodopseudomonas palustris]|nr:hypothetical protein [Rhodopseudomonas palustris]